MIGEHRPRALALWVLALLSLPALLRNHAWAQAPQDKTKQLIDTFKKVKAAADGKKLSPSEDGANQKVFAALDGFFDFATFASDCLGPTGSKLAPPQQKEFKERLTGLLRANGYPNGGSAFRQGVVKEKGKATESDGRTLVPLTVSFPKDDVTMDVTFVWKTGKVVDLILDGDSLAKDYRNQVGRIVAKSGPADLLRRLAEKQKGGE